VDHAKAAEASDSASSADDNGEAPEPSSSKAAVVGGGGGDGRGVTKAVAFNPGSDRFELTSSSPSVKRGRETHQKVPQLELKTLAGPLTSSLHKHPGSC